MKFFTRKKDEVFKRFKFDEQQIQLFEKLRPEVDESITDELLGIIICQKKTYEKCTKSWKIIKSDLIDAHNFGSIEIDESILEVIHSESLLMVPGTKSKDGHQIILVRPGTFLEFPDDQFIKSFLYSWQVFLNESEDLSLNGFQAVVSYIGLTYAKLRFGKKSFFLIPKLTTNKGLMKKVNTLIQKLPLRPQKYHVIDPPWFFYIVKKIASAFVSAKILNRLHLTDLKGVLDDISAENVHRSVGGELKFDLKKVIVKSYFQGDEKKYEELYSKKKKEIDKEVEWKYWLKEEKKEILDEWKKKLEEEERQEKRKTEECDEVKIDVSNME